MDPVWCLIGILSNLTASMSVEWVVYNNRAPPPHETYGRGSGPIGMLVLSSHTSSFVTVNRLF